jgi:hypothetical protein
MPCFYTRWPDNGEINLRTRGRSLAAHLEVLGDLLQDFLGPGSKEVWSSGRRHRSFVVGYGSCKRLTRSFVEDEVSYKRLTRSPVDD